MSKRATIKSLRCDAVSASSSRVDWAEAWRQSYDEDGYHEAQRCDCCKVALCVHGEASHKDLDTDSDCPGSLGTSEGPMMNFFYPCPIGDPEAAALAIVDLPLCVVQHGDEPGLALTGGGMDLTWAICEAYMVLGYLPPADFAGRLPAMCGRGTSARDRWIAAGCRASCRAAARWARNGLTNINRAVRFGEHEASNRARKALAS